MINEINRLIEVKNERKGSNERSVCVCSAAKRWQTIPTKLIKCMKWHEQRTTHESRRIHMLFAVQIPEMTWENQFFFGQCECVCVAPIWCLLSLRLVVFESFNLLNLFISASVEFRTYTRTHSKPKESDPCVSCIRVLRF